MEIVESPNGFKVTLPNGEVIREVTISFPQKATVYQKQLIMRDKISNVLAQINKQPPKALLEWRKQNQ